MVVAEKSGSEEYSPSESHLNGSIHDFTLGMAFLLCKGGHEGEDHFAFRIKGIQSLCLEKDTDRMWESQQFTDISNAVYNIPGETGHALSNDKIDFSFFAVFNHLLELITVLQGSTGYAFIRIDLYKFPVWTFADDIVVMVFL